jgi:hypothetical protein
MATFPAIIPAARRYGFGLFPVTIETGFGGGSIRFRHGNQRYGINLELGYEYLSQAEAQSLRNHYRSQDGGHRSFLLPDLIWNGHSAPDLIVPRGTAWVYASEPEETHRPGLLFDVRVQLLQVIQRGFVPGPSVPGVAEVLELVMAGGNAASTSGISEAIELVVAGGAADDGSE